jgi:Cu/Ag efflux pump CusA
MIDYINQLRSIHGRSLLDAIIEGGRTRLRPVMLTAITTALGLAPMALGFSFDFFQFKFVVGGESSAWWAMLATGMIFGLLISTVMTLVLVPCAYLVSARWGERGKLLFRRIFGNPDELSDDQKPKPPEEPPAGSRKPVEDDYPVMEPVS